MKTKLSRPFIEKLAFDKRPEIVRGAVIGWVANKKIYIVFDEEMAGFGIKVCKSRMVYVVQVRVGITVVKSVVGNDGHLTLKEARDKARNMINALKAGVDLNAEKRQARTRVDVPTVKELVGLYKDYLSLKSRGKPSANTLKVLDKTVKNLGKVAEIDITKLEENTLKTRFLEVAKDNGQAAAEQAFEWLRTMLNYAIKTLRDAEGKPVLAVNVALCLLQPGYLRTPVEKERDYLNNGVRRPIENTPNKMGAWLRAVIELRERNKLGAEYLLTTILLGARMRETSPLKWADRIDEAELKESSYVNLEDRRVFFRETKNKLNHELPLADWLYGLLKERHEKVKGKHVFPARNSARSKTPIGYYSDPRAFIVSVSKKSGIAFTPHDLRRTFATVVNLMDISTITTKRLLNHRSAFDDTSKYAALGLEPLRPYMQRIENEMLKHAPAGLVS